MVNLGYTASLLTLQAGFVRHLSGRENALLSGMILGMKKTLIRDKMELIKDFSELGDFFEQPISTYSSGMRARLGFSIAFQLDPDILLIDEVLGVGDELFKKKSKRMLRRKILSNKTVVLVSHSAATIRDLCDRAVWIHAGSSKVEGPADEVVALYLESLETEWRHPGNEPSSDAPVLKRHVTQLHGPSETFPPNGGRKLDPAVWTPTRTTSSISLWEFAESPTDTASTSTIGSSPRRFGTSY